MKPSQQKGTKSSQINREMSEKSESICFLKASRSFSFAWPRDFGHANFCLLFDGDFLGGRQSGALKSQSLKGSKCPLLYKASHYIPMDTPLKTNMTLENQPFSMGNTSSNGGFSIVMFVFGGVHGIDYKVGPYTRKKIEWHGAPRNGLFTGVLSPYWPYAPCTVRWMILHLWNM